MKVLFWGSSLYLSAVVKRHVSTQAHSRTNRASHCPGSERQDLTVPYKSRLPGFVFCLCCILLVWLVRFWGFRLFVSLLAHQPNTWQGFISARSLLIRTAKAQKGNQPWWQGLQLACSPLREGVNWICTGCGAGLKPPKGSISSLDHQQGTDCANTQA